MHEQRSKWITRLKQCCGLTVAIQYSRHFSAPHLLNNLRPWQRARGRILYAWLSYRGATISLCRTFHPGNPSRNTRDDHDFVRGKKTSICGGRFNRASGQSLTPHSVGRPLPHKLNHRVL